MCGIAGICPAGDVDRAAVLSILSHRGPDESGDASIEAGGARIWLGHTRLAILDLSAAGRQPMSSQDARWWITYNGEIYNHQELRRELERSHDVKFRGHSDTETLVESLAAWGLLRTLPLLNGMFAFAAVDRKKGVVYLVRDAFGVKPLYYRRLPGGGMAFASEIRAIRALTGQSVSVSQQGLQTFLALRYVPSPDTLEDGLFRLPPGHYMAVTLKDSDEVVGCFLKAGEERTGASVGEAADLYTAALRQAVHRQMLSDVPVGVLLSGGVDSGLVAALAREKDQSLTAFTVGFGERFPECEISDATATCKQLGLRHESVVIDEDNLWSALPSVVAAIEEPLGTTSVLAMWYLVALARKYVTVVLTGQGTDEPWGGYRRYQMEVLRQLLPGPVPWRALGKVTRLYKHFPDSLERTLRALPETDVVPRFVNAYTLFTPEQRFQLTGTDSAGCAEEAVRYWLTATAWAGLEPVERMMRIDAHMNLADDLLLYGDKIAMSVGLEARVPMLDTELTRFVDALPRKHKVSVGRGKVLHRMVACQYLPASIIEARKRGFLLPFGSFSRGPWRGRIEDVLFNRGARYLRLLRKDAVKRLWTEHLHRWPDRSRQIFALLVFAVWCEIENV